MKKIAAGFVLFVAIVASSVLALRPATALDVSGFQAGNIILDSVMTNSNAMSVSQIQTFLNNKVPGCDTSGSLPATDFGYPNLTHAQYAARMGWQSPPYTCLRNYSENSKSAAQIIYNIAQTYHINPQVLLVTLQKEQGLVTDTWPLNSQYKTATGYGCPDTAACNSQYYGFTNQVTWTAKMFNAIETASPTWYTPYILGKNYIQYNPSSSCGGSYVTIQNRATQALYNYTPYQPNSYALSGGSDSSYPNCGAFGNRNFYSYFKTWFGSPNANATYGYSLQSAAIYSDSSYQTQIGTTAATIKPNTEFYIKVQIKNTGNQVWYDDFLHLGTENPRDHSSPFTNSTWLNPARPPAMQQDTVAPGATATFLFKAVAPSSLGAYNEGFGVLLEGQRWFSGTFNLALTVATPSPVYSSQVVSFDVYKDTSHMTKLSTSNLSLYAGSRVYVVARLKNTGNRTWPASTTKVATTDPRNRVSQFSDTTWPDTNRPAIAASDTPVGSTVTFNFSLAIPDNLSGNYTEQFGLVIEGLTWISDDIGGLELSISPRPPAGLDASNRILLRGNILLSVNESRKFVLQGDGNLVLYDSRGKALWNTQTNNKDGSRLVLQGDGNLVLYDSRGKALWNTNTVGS